MNIGERIRFKRKQRKMSADKLGELIGKDRATIYRYENNEIENVPYTLIGKIAEVLEVEESYLMGWDNESKNQLPSAKYSYFPDVKISAGNPLTVDGTIDQQTINVPDFVLQHYAGGKDIFFAHINGESMNKIIQDGALIAVKKVDINNLKNGDIVVYSCCHEYAVKRFYRTDNGILFKPESTDYTFKDHEIKADELNDLVIYGKVIYYGTTI